MSKRGVVLGFGERTAGRAESITATANRAIDVMCVGQRGALRPICVFLASISDSSHLSIEGGSSDPVSA